MSLLTIYIPTFNRAKFLARLLDALSSELQDFHTEVEVLIGDNSDSEESMKVAEKSSFAVRYVRHALNIGPDQNIVFGLRNCSTEFIWIMGDDDLPIPGSLATILALCRDLRERKEVSLVYLGRQVVDSSGIEVIGRVVDVNSSTDLPSQDFVDLMGIELLTVSCFLRRRDAIDLVELNSYLTGWGVSPLVLSLSALRLGFRGTATDDPLVVYEDANKEGWIRNWPSILHVYLPLVFFRYRERVLGRKPAGIELFPTRSINLRAFYLARGLGLEDCRLYVSAIMKNPSLILNSAIDIGSKFAKRVRSTLNALRATRLNV